MRVTPRSLASLVAVLLVAGIALTGCGGKKPKPTANVAGPGTSASASDAAASSADPSASASASAPAASPGTSKAAPLPAAGNPGGKASVPAEARAEDTSHPTRTVGTGTAASCTSEAVV